MVYTSTVCYIRLAVNLIFILPCTEYIVVLGIRNSCFITQYDTSEHVNWPGPNNIRVAYIPRLLCTVANN